MSPAHHKKSAIQFLKEIAEKREKVYLPTKYRCLKKTFVRDGQTYFVTEAIRGSHRSYGYATNVKESKAQTAVKSKKAFREEQKAKQVARRNAVPRRRSKSITELPSCPGLLKPTVDESWLNDILQDDLEDVAENPRPIPAHLDDLDLDLDLDDMDDVGNPRPQPIFAHLMENGLQLFTFNDQQGEEMVLQDTPAQLGVEYPEPDAFRVTHDIKRDPISIRFWDFKENTHKIRRRLPNLTFCDAYRTKKWPGGEIMETEHNPNFDPLI